MKTAKNRQKVEKKRGRGRPAIGRPRSIRVSDADWSRWLAAADLRGKTLSDWLREAVEFVWLREAAESVIARAEKVNL